MTSQLDMSVVATVPKPRIVSRRITTLDGVCLARQMRLANTDENLKVYYSILDTVGTLCEQFLPHTEKVPSGTEWKRILIEKAIQANPTLKAYHDAWPVTTMIQMHRQSRKKGSRNGIMRTTQEASGVSPSGGRSYRANKAARPQESSSSRGNTAIAASSGVICMRRAAQKTRASQINTNGARTGSDIANINAGPSVQKTSTFIEHFLESLPQDLRVLLPVFVDHGVVDEPSLRGMLRMQNWPCWLYSWVVAGQITELQFKMVIDGLAAL
ncbi:hypothetical protein BV20DRAFT_1118070 [Pilatotrama ljubarskyi]|nr:hypothetical protein BV20DRAFT_1118070 [Pilatotrama ljubarskyi]